MAFSPPGYCPNCGEHVEAGALACPSCGSCAGTGWSEESDYDGLDLPEQATAEQAPSPAAKAVKVILGIALLLLLVWALALR